MTNLWIWCGIMAWAILVFMLFHKSQDLFAPRLIPIDGRGLLLSLSICVAGGPVALIIALMRLARES